MAPINIEHFYIISYEKAYKSLLNKLKSSNIKINLNDYLDAFDSVAKVDCMGAEKIVVARISAFGKPSQELEGLLIEGKFKYIKESV